MSQAMIGLISTATWQTLIMVVIPTLVAVLLGIPFGVLLFTTQPGQILEGVAVNRFFSLLINGVRSIPFIILMVAITPITHFIVGTSIGTVAAMVPLALAAIPFLARIIESALNEVPNGLIEASYAMGATPLQIIWYVLLPEARGGIIRGVTLTTVTLVGYSAMAGAVGGGGLGDLGVRYGYDRFEVSVMLVTVAILIVMVQLLQFIGDYFAKRFSQFKK